jgi:hypothetical protein
MSMWRRLHPPLDGAVTTNAISRDTRSDGKPADPTAVAPFHILRSLVRGGEGLEPLRR